MSVTTTAFPMQKAAALAAVFWGGLLCGALDITAALVVYGLFEVKPIRLLQGIAAGLLGPRSYDDGLAAALFGLLLHFLIAFSAAAVYFAVSRAMPLLVQHAIGAGVMYGVLVYFFMSWIILPLSAATKRPFSFRMMIVGVIIHIFCVGLPISLTVRRYSIY